MDLRRITMTLFVGGLLVCGVLAMPAVVRAQPEDQHSHDAKAAEPAAKTAKCKMCESMMARMKAMAKLKQMLADAKGLAKAEGATKAVAKLDEALALIEKQHKGMHAAMKQHMQKMHKGMMGKGLDAKKPKMTCPMCDKMKANADEGKIVNARCPIMGSKLDPAKVPANLTRVWNGQKVGFCCGGCPKAWDKLSDEQKQKKLDAAMVAK